jgi:DNA-binding PadR family transcriptional regulator/vacuolar-type H+-ATPase subunit H
MANLIYTYALLKALYDQEEDYLDTFWTFAVQGLVTEGFSDLNSIQANLKQKTDMEIPLHVLGSILKRAKKKGYLERRLEFSGELKRELYKLTDKGRDQLDILETQKDVERRISNLLEDMEGFFSEQNISLDREQILDLLMSILQENIYPLIEFINPSIGAELPRVELGRNSETLVDYLKLAEKQKPEHFHTLQDMILGSIVSTTLYSEDDVNEIATRKFQHCVAILDTNFIFSVLDLHHTPEDNKPVKELLDLLKNNGFSLRVFDFTIGEISRVLGLYLSDEHRYPTTVMVDDVCSCLKRNGWTKTQVIEFIRNLENILHDLGIETELTKINLKTYEPPDKVLRSLILKYKPDQKLLPQNHDLAAIECIQKYRGRSVRQIERCRAIFLSSDAGLSRFSFIEMGHKDNMTVSEVIQDRLLTNILWLKDPSSRLPLKSIIAAHSRGLFVKARVWNKFYDVLSNLKRTGKIDDDRISMLFYHNYIEDALAHFGNHETDKITPEFVLSEIEKASRLIEEETEKRIRAKEGEFLKKLSKKKAEHESERLEWIEETRIKIRDSAQKSVKTILRVIRISLAGIVAAALIYCIVTKSWEVLNNIWLVIIVLSLISGIVVGSINAMWRRIEKRWSHRIYYKRLREAGLDKPK